MVNLHLYIPVQNYVKWVTLVSFIVGSFVPLVDNSINKNGMQTSKKAYSLNNFSHWLGTHHHFFFWQLCLCYQGDAHVSTIQSGKIVPIFEKLQPLLAEAPLFEREQMLEFCEELERNWEVCAASWGSSAIQRRLLMLGITFESHVCRVCLSNPQSSHNMVFSVVTEDNGPSFKLCESSQRTSCDCIKTRGMRKITVDESSKLGVVSIHGPAMVSCLSRYFYKTPAHEATQALRSQPRWLQMTYHRYVDWTIRIANDRPVQVLEHHHWSQHGRD